MSEPSRNLLGTFYNPGIASKSPPSAAWRWAVLIAVSVAMFGNYYAYDSIGPVADSLQRILHYTDTQIGTLNAIYSFPNIIMVLIGGVIVDRFGAARATLAFAVIQAIGALVTALSPMFPVMAAGRLIFGLGAESMIVAITVVIGQWFVGLMVDRIGRRAAFMDFGTFLLGAVFPVLAYTNALWIATVMIGIAFSLVPAVLWPAVPYIVAANRLGTAYGLMTMLQNIGMMLANLAAGALNDASHAGPSNPDGYRPMLWMFLFLSLFGFVFAAALRIRESGPRGHGLETIRATGKEEG